MKTLGIDTSGRVCTAAVSENDHILSEVYIDYKLTHSEQLMTAIDNALKYAHTDISDIDLFGITTGPGSFTGIRIGVCTVKAMAHAQNKPICAVSALEANAKNSFGFDGTVCTITDARNRFVYTAAFENGKRLFDDEIITIDELINKLNGKVLFVGDAVPVYKDLLSQNLSDAVFMPDSLLLPRASAVCSLAYEMYLKGEYSTYNDIDAFYLRASQAEQNLKCRK